MIDIFRVKKIFYGRYSHLSHLRIESNVFMCHIHTEKPKMILLFCRVDDTNHNEGIEKKKWNIQHFAHFYDGLAWIRNRSENEKRREKKNIRKRENGFGYSMSQWTLRFGLVNMKLRSGAFHLALELNCDHFIIHIYLSFECECYVCVLFFPWLAQSLFHSLAIDLSCLVRHIYIYPFTCCH